MRAAVVDDDEHFAEKIQRSIQDFCDRKGEKALVHLYSNGHSLLHDLEEARSYDAFFLDINMPGMDGISLMDSIKRFQTDARIIFVTAYPKYMRPCIHKGIFDFIEKTESEKELLNTLERVLEDEKRKLPRAYVIQAKKQQQKIALDDIFYIEMLDRNSIFHCQEEKYYERKPLKAVYEELPEQDFAYINAGQIVNMNRIRKATADVVVLDDDTKLYYSRRMKKEFDEKMLGFLERVR